MSRWKWTALLACMAGLLGCGGAAISRSPEHVALGKQFLLAEEPAGAVGILDYRESALASESAAKSTPPPSPLAAEIALVGRIGGGKTGGGQLTWSDQSAAFLLSDPAHDFASGGHECTSENCPFCKGKQPADHGQAIVMLTDGAGRVPAIDARKLLPLAEGQTIVVSGRPEVNALGQLVVHARGLYVRR